MDASAALAFVREHGIVLVSARGAAPTLTHAIAGEAIKGSWWAHPQGKQIFAVLQRVSDDPDVAVCRLLADKLTLVHRRLWPALAALAPEIAPARLARVTQQHTAAGHHVNTETPFADWLPLDAAEEGRAMPREAALAALGPSFVTKPSSRKAAD
jgi:phosphoketolase